MALIKVNLGADDSGSLTPVDLSRPLAKPEPAIKPEERSFLDNALMTSVAAAEAAGALGTGMMVGLPASGISMLVNALGQGGDLEEAVRVGGETAQRLTYQPQSELGQEFTGALHKAMGLIAEPTRFMGGEMVAEGVQALPEFLDPSAGTPAFDPSTEKITPEIATALTTPMELYLYGLVFKKAHGFLPKWAEKIDPNEVFPVAEETFKADPEMKARVDEYSRKVTNLSTEEALAESEMEFEGDIPTREEIHRVNQPEELPGARDRAAHAEAERIRTNEERIRKLGGGRKPEKLTPVDLSKPLEPLDTGITPADFLEGKEKQAESIEAQSQLMTKPEQSIAEMAKSPELTQQQATEAIQVINSPEFINQESQAFHKSRVSIRQSLDRVANEARGGEEPKAYTPGSVSGVREVVREEPATLSLVDEDVSSITNAIKSRRKFNDDSIQITNDGDIFLVNEDGTIVTGPKRDSSTIPNDIASVMSINDFLNIVDTGKKGTELAKEFKNYTIDTKLRDSGKVVSIRDEPTAVTSIRKDLQQAGLGEAAEGPTPIGEKVTFGDIETYPVDYQGKTIYKLVDRDGYFYEDGTWVHTYEGKPVERTFETDYAEHTPSIKKTKLEVIEGGKKPTTPAIEGTEPAGELVQLPPSERQVAATDELYGAVKGTLEKKSSIGKLEDKSHQKATMQKATMDKIAKDVSNKSGVDVEYYGFTPDFGAVRDFSDGKLTFEEALEKPFRHEFLIQSGSGDGVFIYTDRPSVDLVLKELKDVERWKGDQIEAGDPIESGYESRFRKKTTTSATEGTDVAPDEGVVETPSYKKLADAKQDYDMNRGSTATYEAAEKSRQKFMEKNPEFGEAGHFPTVIQIGKRFRHGFEIKLSPETEQLLYAESLDIEKPSDVAKKEGLKRFNYEEAENEMLNIQEDIKDWHQNDGSIRGAESLVDRANEIANDLTRHRDLVGTRAIDDPIITGVDKMTSFLKQEMVKDITSDPSIHVDFHPLEYKKNKGIAVVYNAEGEPFNSYYAALDWMQQKGIKGKVEPNPSRADLSYRGRLERQLKDKQDKTSFRKQSGSSDGWVIELGTATKKHGAESARKTVGDIVEEVKEPYTTVMELFKEVVGDALKDFGDRFTEEGPGGPESGQLAVDFKAIIEGIKNLKTYIRSQVPSWPDISTEAYKNMFKAVERHRITYNVGLLEAQVLSEKMSTRIPDLEARERITLSIDNPEAKLTNPAEIRMADSAKEVFDLYREEFKELGMLNEFIDDYVPHVIKKTPDGKFVTNAQLSKFKRRSRKEGIWRTIRELEDAGYVLEKDISELLAQYVYTANKAIANRNLALYMVDAKTEGGEPLLTTASEVPLGEKNKNYFPLDQSDKLKGWMKTGRNKKGEVPQRVKDLTEGELYVHRNAFHEIENIVSTRASDAYKLYAKGRMGVKRAIMYNPLIHGFNFESNVMSMLGRDYVSQRFFGGLDPAGMQRLANELVLDGGELVGLYNIGKRLGADIYEMRPTDRITFDKALDNPKLALRNPIRTMVDLSDQLLWDKWIKTGQLLIYKVARERFMERDGMTRSEAGQAAAALANDLGGTPPRTWYTKRQRLLLTNAMFAKSWSTGLARTATGAVGGKVATGSKTPKFLRFEGLSDKQLKGMTREYRKVLVKGVIGTMATANMIQAGFLSMQGKEFYPTWQNEDGHKMDIDTGLVDDEKNKIYVRNWLFRQTDDYVKVLKGEFGRMAASKMEPVFRTLLSAVVNHKIGQGKPVRERGAGRLEQLGQTGKYIIEGITPLDTFIPHEDEVKRWYDILLPLTGTWIRRGVGPDRIAGSMFKEYYDWQAKDKFDDKQSMNNIKRLIKLDKMDEAVSVFTSAMKEGRLTEAQFENAYKRLKIPIWSRIAGPEGLHPTFARFLLELDEKDRDKYLKNLEKLSNK